MEATGRSRCTLIFSKSSGGVCGSPSKALALEMNDLSGMTGINSLEVWWRFPNHRMNLAAPPSCSVEWVTQPLLSSAGNSSGNTQGVAQSGPNALACAPPCRANPSRMPAIRGRPRSALLASAQPS